MKIEELQKEMIAAMKAKDKPRKETISMLVAAVKKLAIDEGCREDIQEELVTRAILKELRMAQEQVNTCPEDRVELKAEYEQKLTVIKEFAPVMMSAEEVKSLILEKFSEVAATKNKGLIMKSVMPELKGKADGQIINQIVGELCQ